MADKTRRPPVSLRLNFERIEQEGDRAAQELARELVGQTFANGGSPDISRLNRAGPEVRRHFLRLLAKAPPKSRPPAPTEAKAPPPAEPNPPPAPARNAKLPPSAQRAWRHWLLGRRDVPGFTTRAIRRGLIVAALTGCVATAVVRFLGL